MEQIKDIAGLLKITKNGVYELTNDIDCKGENLGRILVQFSGQINGNGYKIFNFQLKYILKYDGQKLGIFENIRRSTIKNIEFICEKIEISGDYSANVAYLVCDAYDSLIENCNFEIKKSNYHDEIPLIYDGVNCDIDKTKYFINNKKSIFFKFLD